MPQIINPYAKTTAATAAATREKENGGPQANNMGPQSQRRLSLQDRTHQLQSQSRKKQKTGQQTLFGQRAFDPLEDCEVCKGKRCGRAVHRAHHKLCNNKRGGARSASTIALQQEERRLQVLFATPLTETEKCSAQHTTKESMQAFFVPRDCPVAKTKITSTTTTTTTTMSLESSMAMGSDVVTASSLCDSVTTILKDPRHAKFHKASNAPAAMLAFAKVVVEGIILNRAVDTANHFDGLTMTVPANQQSTEPHYHSIVGQKLLYVDWKRMYGLDITCPRCKRCHLKNDRTNYSKNKILFPVFVMEGPPLWCMVMSMVCPCCRSRINSNSGEILSKLPAYARVAYPVDTKYALENKNCHLGKSATNIMDLIMPTYGNGDLCSRLLYNAINRSYLDRVEDYYSTFSTRNEQQVPQAYVEKDGYYITAYPPLGDGIRDAYDAACSNQYTPWGLSDHDRHTRELKAVKCGLIFAQDHTHEVTKNYFKKKQLGATALWDVSTETGEIASAVLVPTTKTIHFSHAATALTRREGFSPAAMYSDTWPVKSDFWNALFKSKLEGRLGLFHYIQRVTKTLKKQHTDHFIAVNGLLNCICHYNVDDHEKLLKALTEGTLSTKYSEEEVREMRGTKAFRQRYDRYLRKEIRPPHIMCGMLDDWFDRFKCSASEGSRHARGRRDPLTGATLFTGETKEAIRLAKVNAKYLQDPLPLEQMYFVIQPNPNATHQLKEYMSRRGESSLESFHSMLAHFGNCGMRTLLIDNLNLTGTARHNLSIRHKLRLTSLTQGSRKKIPAAFESVVAFFNHSELAHVNAVASLAGLSPQTLPFKQVEPLPADNGERFFSEYITWMNETKPQYDNVQSRCLCKSCNAMAMPVEQRQQQQQPQPTTEAQPTQELVRPNSTPRPNTMPEERPTATATTTNNYTTATVGQPATNIRPKEHVTTHKTQQQHHHQLLMMTPQPQLHQYMDPNMMMGYQPMMPQMFMPYPPWTAATCMTPSAASFCCGRYRHWHNTAGRRGRPPHDDHCHDPIMRSGNQLIRRSQSGNKEKNRRDNPCGYMI